MKIQDVYDLWERFDNSDATEFELGIAGDFIKLKRSLENTDAKPAMVNVSKETTAVFGKNKNNKTDDTAETPKTLDGTVVKAPLVGTFYAAPSPNDEPFVKVGSKVKKGDVIGIIEAMKLMNEVVASSDGEVTEYLVEDGSMVEFDQPLVVIR